MKVMLNPNGALTQCNGEYCSDSKVTRQKGKGGFKGWTLWICDHCGQVAKMEKT